MIINKQKLPSDNASATCIIPGRALLVRIPWQENNSLSVLAIYAPNSPLENKNFWAALDAKWKDENNHLPNVDILLGDFNMVEAATDRLPNRADNGDTVESLWNLKLTLRVSDAWRQTHPEPDVLYTYRQDKKINPSRSRIDRIYLSTPLLNGCHDSDTVYVDFSDHDLMKIKITHCDAPTQGRGRWSLPSWLLYHKEFLSHIKRQGNDILTMLEDHTFKRSNQVNPQTLFQKFEADIRSEAKQLARTKNCKLTTMIELAEKEHKTLLNRNVQSADKEKDDTALHALSDRIKMLKNELANYQVTTSRANLRAWGEELNKQWTRLGKEQQCRDPIACLQKDASQPIQYTTNSKNMAAEMAKYHNRIQLKDILDPEPARHAALEHVLDHITQAPQHLMTDLASLLHYEDITFALKNAPPDKAPGPNGIPNELYLSLHNSWQSSVPTHNPPHLDISRLLLHVFNDIETYGVACEEFSEGWLCPIYKNKGDRRDPSSYRPITVLNTSYKLFTSALMKKLVRVAPSLIHDSQAGFIPGRSIHDQIDLAKTMIHLCEATGQEGAIVALDQEKAYDRIRHDYLWLVLERFGIPPLFINTIKALYSLASTTVMVNGEISPKFKVTRGVRQGDPISCLLFNLAIEPLSQMIRSAPNLRGLTTSEANGHTHRLIVSLFADDTSVFLSKFDSFLDLEGILSTWCLASGARFNVHKTVIIPLGPEDYRHSLITSRKLDSTVDDTIDDNIRILQDGHSTRYLGAHIGNHTDSSGIWSSHIEKINTALDRWDRIHPTLQGRAHVIRMVVGGRPNSSPQSNIPLPK